MVHKQTMNKTKLQFEKKKDYTVTTITLLIDLYRRRAHVIYINNIIFNLHNIVWTFFGTKKLPMS